ncbi:MAG: hypothetical protein HC871_07040 [Rhizobiales bacterium]|nr:hypothetical protein [Hyphomicrobiales bacterium]
MAEQPTQAFLSYTHADDDYLSGGITWLCDDLQHAVTGERFAIFLDRDAIAFGQHWPSRIEAVLSAQQDASRRYEAFELSDAPRIKKCLFQQAKQIETVSERPAKDSVPTVPDPLAQRRAACWGLQRGLPLWLIFL